MKNPIKKSRSKANIKRFVALSAFIIISCASAVAVVEYFKQRKTIENEKIYAKKHDDALIVINNLILLSEEIQSYYNKISKKKDKEKISDQYLTKISINCADIATTLKSLDSSDDPLVQEVAFTAERFRIFFEQEAMITLERSIVLATYKIAKTVDASAITRIRVNAMQNQKNEHECINLLTNISFDFFEKNKQYLNQTERDTLSALIYSKFKKPIDQYIEECKKAGDWTKVSTPAFECASIFMYLSINA